MGIGSTVMTVICLPPLLVEHAVSKLLRRTSALEELMEDIGSTTDALDIRDIERMVEFESR